ncbi:MAG: hypothetical protein ACF788_04575 [Novipirellula sp. JB048]
MNLSALAILFAVAGCGDEATPTPADPAPSSTAVAPTAPQAAGENAAVGERGESGEANHVSADSTGSGSTGSEAPGGMELPSGGLELPPGDLPAAESNPPPPEASGGMEMPDLQTSRKPSVADSVAPAAAAVIYGSLPEIRSRIAETGKVTVVDYWSLACQPCLEEFPGLVRLQNQFPDQVQCLSVDIDFDGRKSRPPNHYETRVTAFVNSVGATFPNYISSTPSDEVYAELELDSIPAVLIYDAEGELVKKFVDAGDTVGFSYDDDVIPFVKQMIE